MKNSKLNNLAEAELLCIVEANRKKLARLGIYSYDQKVITVSFNPSWSLGKVFIQLDCKTGRMLYRTIRDLNMTLNFLLTLKNAGVLK